MAVISSRSRIALKHSETRSAIIRRDSSDGSSLRRLHLSGADDGAEQADHAEELLSAPVLYGVFLTHVRHGIKRRAEQHQTVAQQDVWGWGGERRVLTLLQNRSQNHQHMKN